MNFCLSADEGTLSQVQNPLWKFKLEGGTRVEIMNVIVVVCCSRVEGLDAKFAAPGSLWRFLDFWNNAVHVIATVTVVAKQQLEQTKYQLVPKTCVIFLKSHLENSKRVQCSVFRPTQQGRCLSILTQNQIKVWAEGAVLGERLSLSLS